MVPSDYLHRIGRTGRAGLRGTAVSLVCVDEAPLLRDIERLLGGPIPSQTIAGFEPNRSIVAQPIRLRTGGGGRRPAPRREVMAHRGVARGPMPRRPGRTQHPGGRRDHGGAWAALPGERRAKSARRADR
jgi:ATP-dependent RNA helicase RhlE